jgi:hypothetical protein
MSDVFLSLKPLGATDGDALTLRPTFGAQFRKGAGAGLGGGVRTTVGSVGQQQQQPN